MDVRLKPFDFAQAAARAGLAPDGQPLKRTQAASGADVGQAMAQALKSVSQSQQQALIARALDTLSKKERAAIVLRDLEGLETEEVARILGSSQSTVRAQISSARAKIKLFRDRALSRSRRG